MSIAMESSSVNCVPLHRAETLTLNGLLTVEMSLDIRLISTLSGDIKAEFGLHENGAGFTPTEAQSRAEERLANKLRDRLRTALD